MSSPYLALNLVKATTDKAEIGKQLLEEINRLYSTDPEYAALPTKSLETVLKLPKLSRFFAAIKSDLRYRRDGIFRKLTELLLEYDAIVAEHDRLSKAMRDATEAARTEAQAAAAEEVMERTLNESAATRSAAAGAGAAPGSLRTTAFRNGLARGDYGGWNRNNNSNNNNASRTMARFRTGLGRGSINLTEATGRTRAEIERRGQSAIANLGRQVQTLRSKGIKAVPRKSRNARHRKQQKTRRFSRR
jgi:hypothetical protein